MILYTIASYENIFPYEPDSNTKYMQVEHGFVEVEKGDKGMKVKRLISTLPSEYLNPKYSPGSIYGGN